MNTLNTKNNSADIINNQSQLFVHLQLTQAEDAAYLYSVENDDPINMQMVLRAHGHDHSFDDAELQILVAKQAA